MNLNRPSGNSPQRCEPEDLVTDLKFGGTSLALALAGLSDEECATVGVFRQWSVTNLVAHLVDLDRMALMRVLAVCPNAFRGGDQRALQLDRSMSGATLEELLSEFRVLRGAIIRWAEQALQEGNTPAAARRFVAELSVARFQRYVAHIESWRSSAHSPISRRDDRPREFELNARVLEFLRSDFLCTDMHVLSVLSQSLGPFYSENAVFWIGEQLIAGKQAAKIIVVPKKLVNIVLR